MGISWSPLCALKGVKRPVVFGSFFYKFSLVQSLSHVRLFAVPWTAARQASLYITNSWSLLKIMSIKSVMPSNHLTLGRPLLLPPTIFPSIRVFLNESVLCIRWPKYWSFSFSISPSNECLGLISFRMDLLDLLQVKCIQSKKKLNEKYRLPLFFLSLNMKILWNSAFRWVYLSFSPLPLASLLFSAICKTYSDNHFAFLHFFFLGDHFFLDHCLLYNVASLCS